MTWVHSFLYRKRNFMLSILYPYCTCTCLGELSHSFPVPLIVVTWEIYESILAWMALIWYLTIEVVAAITFFINYINFRARKCHQILDHINNSPWPLIWEQFELKSAANVTKFYRFCSCRFHLWKNGQESHLVCYWFRITYNNRLSKWCENHEILTIHLRIFLFITSNIYWEVEFIANICCKVCQGCWSALVTWLGFYRNGTLVGDRHCAKMTNCPAVSHIVT
jgi:hypothetical protein